MSDKNNNKNGSDKEKDENNGNSPDEDINKDVLNKDDFEEFESSFAQDAIKELGTEKGHDGETSFAREMQYGFSEYAKYVISDRALPDGRDGLKPVHRRILWAMQNLKLGPKSSFKKCARIVGETTGRFHPHAGGVYESLVRLAQDWSLRYPLVDPQGNFGSIDGYPPAAMRYTEARLARISLDLMENISPKIVEFIDNFDGEEQEPTVLPVKLPHLLLNGSYGIAVGMSSNIPPHNLQELMDACIAIVDNPQITTDELMKIVLAPDFPTGGVIVGTQGIDSLFRTGKGSLRVRSKVHLETKDTHKVRKPIIVVEEIPYMQNKSNLIQSIAGLIDEKKILGVKNIEDHTKDKIRIEIEIDESYTDDLSYQTILAQLFKRTNLETLFHARINAFVYGRPLMLNLIQSLAVFLDFRELTVKKIAEEELEKVEARIHILEGLIIASDNISEVIQLIRASESRAKAHDGLKTAYNLSDLQAKAVLDMTLGRLARMEQDNLKKEAKEREIRKQELLMIINDRFTLLELMKKEFMETKDKFREGRRTDLLPVDNIHKVEGRPILHQRDLLITSTTSGYIRSIDWAAFKLQGRGGKGVIGIALDKNEFLNDLIVTSNLEDLLMITSEGQVFQVPAYQINEVKSRNTKGHIISRVLPIEANIVKIVNIAHDGFLQNRTLVTVTKKGIIKRTTLDKYQHIRTTGIRCLSFKDDDDEVVDSFITEDPGFIFIATKNGSAVVFDEAKVRPTGRTAQGVIGVKLMPGDEVASAFPVLKSSAKDTSILTVTNKGKGKRTPFDKYRKTNRGTKGVINIKTAGGTVTSSMPVPRESGDATISLVNSTGILIKVNLKGIRNMGRSTQGVRVMRLKANESLIMATSIVDEESEIEKTPDELNPEVVVDEEPADEILESADDPSDDSEN